MAKGKLNLSFDVESQCEGDMTGYYQKQKDGKLMLVAMTPNYPTFKN